MYQDNRVQFCALSKNLLLHIYEGFKKKEEKRVGSLHIRTNADALELDKATLQIDL